MRTAAQSIFTSGYRGRLAEAEAEAPSGLEVEQALERVREAAVGFDELFTAMTVVQRHLVGLTRGIDADAVARLEPVEATDLVGKLNELVVLLRDLQRLRAPVRSSGSPAPAAAGLDRQLEEHGALLAERPLRRETVVRLFRSGTKRHYFPMLADLVEQLHREDALAQTLPELRVADVLADMRGLGPGLAATVLAYAELPADVRFEDLGAGDVARLARTLRVTALRIPRTGATLGMP